MIYIAIAVWLFSLYRFGYAKVDNDVFESNKTIILILLFTPFAPIMLLGVVIFFPMAILLAEDKSDALRQTFNIRTPKADEAKDTLSKDNK